jgi:hypothetical protein
MLLVVALVGGVLGCGEKAEQHAEAAKAHADAAVGQSATQMSTQLAAHLAKADAVDGTQDHVVSQCSGCKLKMAGSPDYVLQVGDYSMQFCSAGCRDHLAEGGEAAILALEIPDTEGHDGHNH